MNQTRTTVNGMDLGEALAHREVDDPQPFVEKVGKETDKKSKAQQSDDKPCTIN